MQATLTHGAPETANKGLHVLPHMLEIILDSLPRHAFLYPTLLFQKNLDADNANATPKTPIISSAKSDSGGPSVFLLSFFELLSFAS